MKPQSPMKDLVLAYMWYRSNNMPAYAGLCLDNIRIILNKEND